MISFRQSKAVLCVAALSGLLASCGPGANTAAQLDPATLAGLAGHDRTRLLVPARTPPLIAGTEQEILDVATVARRLTPERLAATRGSRMVEVAALPWLRSAPEGMKFLSAAAPKALARGAPDNACPVAAISSKGAETAEQAAISALSNCLAELKGAPDCGCQLMAVDQVVLAPRADLSFAPSVTATLISDAGATRLVADRRGESPAGEVTLRDATGPFGVLFLKGGDAEMTLTARPGEVFMGRRIKFGYRRGRIAERLVLTSQTGDQFTLLIGVEYRDIQKSES